MSDITLDETQENDGEVRCAVIGYGAAFNMGKLHCALIRDTEELEIVAVCDLDKERLEAAKKDFPWVTTYDDLCKLLKQQDIDLVTVVTPPNTHAPLALQCLKAGKHVVVEKPMCITTEEATQMIDEAEKRGLMLSVFQSRRFDGSFLTLKEIVDEGRIGEVFHVETFCGNFEQPKGWWRSDKKVSGGNFYDWGAHHVDWILNLIPEKVTGVTGFFHKRVWNQVTNEDQAETVIRFESGAVADVQISTVASIGKSVWRILGTKGGIVVEPRQEHFNLVTYRDGQLSESKVQFKKSNWPAFYQNVATHLLRGEELKVKPEEARRVIAVMEATEKSSDIGRTVKVPYP